MIVLNISTKQATLMLIQYPNREELKKGKNATHTAFDTGYESLSGFGYTFKKIIGKSPQKSSDKNIILI